ncbi:MAG: HK97 gp10 family phage protein [Clostridiales bacterium]|nr:HK97 gp10 family phage protein [Clostridiales bacterium]
MKISFETRGNFKHIEEFFQKMKDHRLVKTLDKYGKAGVDALASATPVDTGLTASSWGYEIHDDGNTIGVYWTNSNVNNGVNIAVLLQYGHGTGTGGYVQGRDYINPAIQPVFDAMADDIWKEVTSS